MGAGARAAVREVAVHVDVETVEAGLQVADGTCSRSICSSTCNQMMEFKPK